MKNIDGAQLVVEDSIKEDKLFSLQSIEII